MSLTNLPYSVSFQNYFIGIYNEQFHKDFSTLFSDVYLDSAVPASFKYSLSSFTIDLVEQHLVITERGRGSNVEYNVHISQGWQQILKHYHTIGILPPLKKFRAVINWTLLNSLVMVENSKYVFSFHASRIAFDRIHILAYQPLPGLTKGALLKKVVVGKAYCYTGETLLC